MASTSRRVSDASTTNDVHFLKTKISVLEKEVSDYKTRLDELRKAKTQTILKQEKQYLNVSNPISEKNQSNEKTKKEYEEKLSVERLKHDEEVKTLRKNYENELKDLKSKHEFEMNQISLNVPNSPETQNMNTDCKNHIEEIKRLKLENNALKEEVENLFLQMSLKEATWCEKEEQFKKRIEESWQMKYAQWMNEMEKKVSELQETNTMLRVLLENHRPSRDS